MNDSAIFSFEKSSLHFPYGLKVQAAFKDGALHSIHTQIARQSISAPQAADSGQKQPALCSGAKKWCGNQSTPKHTHIKRKI
jgi:hypothetical protein